MTLCSNNNNNEQNQIEEEAFVYVQAITTYSAKQMLEKCWGLAKQKY